MTGLGSPAWGLSRPLGAKGPLFQIWSFACPLGAPHPRQSALGWVLLDTRPPTEVVSEWLAYLDKLLKAWKRARTESGSLVNRSARGSRLHPGASLGALRRLPS